MDTIIIRFPKEVQFSESINLHDNNVTINDVPLSALTHINGSYHYELTVGDIEVNEGDPVKIEFNCPEIRNPIQPGFIKLEYKPKGLADFIFSPAVEIVAQTLEITDVTITPPNALQKAKYSIQVIFGDNALPQKRITVYLEHLETVIDIEEVKIQEQAHEVILMDVDNGTKPGSYKMTVTTDQEQQGAEYSYTIFPSIPTTTITVEGKHGNRNWYVEPPMISFASSDPTAEIWVWWDKKIDQKILYTEAKPADVGQYKAQLFYQSVTAYGEEEPKVQEIWVDTLRPEIVIESPVESKTLVREKEFKIIGRETLIKTVVYGEDTPGYDKIVTINEEAVEVNLEDGYFSKVIELAEGDNLISIHAEDEAGNTWSNEPLIVLDTIMPVIVLEPRKVLDPFIIGKTDPTAQLLINGEIIYVEDDGSFRYELGQVGLHEITVVATDPVGNVNTQKFSLWFGYTIILQIGSLKASTNGENILLNVAPLIQKSKTLVPFRFIGEQLN
ncbi:copper amine oxidase N-terminal domain-containing protein, partial [bacterium]|nr:copper amine oxidase N-terminal domain-containing protein [bacterium]